MTNDPKRGQDSAVDNNILYAQVEAVFAMHGLTMHEAVKYLEPMLEGEQSLSQNHDMLAAMVARLEEQ